MAYEGDLLNQCGVVEVDFARTYVVAVSGSGANVCGHLLLHVDSRGGFYFHVATGDQLGGIRGYPRYMSESGYRKYLSEAGKTELRRIRVDLPNPNGALLYLERLMSDRWIWGGVPNNCVSFVEEIIQAGGGTWASGSNCPSVATAPTIAQRIQEFLARLEAQIYGLYGVPR